jgi:hypothetical protein
VLRAVCGVVLSRFGAGPEALRALRTLTRRRAIPSTSYSTRHATLSGTCARVATAVGRVVVIVSLTAPGTLWVCGALRALPLLALTRSCSPPRLQLPGSSPDIGDWEARLAAYKHANPWVSIVDTPQAARQARALPPATCHLHGDAAAPHCLVREAFP